MKKSSLFTLFIGAIFVVIVAEVMVDGYLQAPAALVKTEGGANVLRPPTQQSQQPRVDVAPQVAGSSSITASLLQKAGLQDYKLQSVTYGGNLLDRIAFASLNSVPIFESHLMKNDIVQVASFYELDAGTAATAREVYDLLKLKATAEVGAILNETNSFGEASFYVNYYQIPEKVFVVFRKGGRVFALTYNKDLHGAMTKLMASL